jgi:hypothetical protein
MVGQVQRFDADNVRARIAQARADRERGATQERITPQLRGLPSKAALKAAAKTVERKSKASQTSPQPIPLDAAEADLCERLTGLLSKAPRRHGEEIPSAQIAFSDRIPTVAEVVPEPAELPTLTELPAFDQEAAAPVAGVVTWMQRSRKQRLKTALGYSLAWIVTLGVIAMTVIGVTVLTLGMDTSVKLATKAQQQSAEAASSAVIALKRLAGQ